MWNDEVAVILWKRETTLLAATNLRQNEMEQIILNHLTFVNKLNCNCNFFYKWFLLFIFIYYFRLSASPLIQKYIQYNIQ